MIKKFTFGDPFPTDAVVTDLNTCTDKIPFLKYYHKDGYRFIYPLEDRDIVYGLGENTRGINKRGYTYTSLCSDDPHHTEDRNSLYAAHNFLLISGKNTFGIFIDCPEIVKFDIGYTDYDTLKITTQSENMDFYIIEDDSLKKIVHAFREMIGKSYIPPKWGFGYQQSRWGYSCEEDFYEVANQYEIHNIPLESIYMDIDYMERYKDFTVDRINFPHFQQLVENLKYRGIKLVPIIDAGVKIEKGYDVYEEGIKNNYFCQDAKGSPFVLAVWPGRVHFPDVLNPEARAWFGSKYKYLTDMGIEGFWNDMNEPSVFDGPGGTMPENNIHLGGGNLPIGSHLMYHNAYGRLMVEASYNGMMAANPSKRPFLLSRSNIIGGQRYAAMWTGDNEATYEQMKLSVPMSITLGLSGQPFNGPDIGGFAGNTTPDLWGNWLGFGAFFPFSRGHASCDTNNKEPWAFTKDIEKESRMALERRYRLLPYLYTAFHVAHKDGQPVMAPVFFADPKDESLRAEEQAFMLGTDLLIIPAFAKNPSLPKGIWENLSLVKGDTKGKYQAKLKVRGGSIIPVGKIIQNVNENSFDPLTLVVCPDEDGRAEGSLYWDKGDGWGFQKGDYKQLTFKAELVDGHHLIVKVTDDKGEDQIDFGMIKVEVLHAGHTYKSSGDIAKGITVKL